MYCYVLKVTIIFREVKCIVSFIQCSLRYIRINGFSPIHTLKPKLGFSG